MSLDLSLIQKDTTNKLSSGIFVKENGENKEILSLEDFKKHFPDADESEFELRETETQYFWSGNITHNLGEMAKHVMAGKTNLYMLLWRPEEIGFDETNHDYNSHVFMALNIMKMRKKELSKYNPENGWGSYDTLLNFTEEYYDALRIAPDGCKIHASR